MSDGINLAGFLQREAMGNSQSINTAEPEPDIAVNNNVQSNSGNTINGGNGLAQDGNTDQPADDGSVAPKKKKTKNKLLKPPSKVEDATSSGVNTSFDVSTDITTAIVVALEQKRLEAFQQGAEYPLGVTLKEETVATQGQSTLPVESAQPIETFPANPEKKKRRKKKQRQTSQEEESAQALLALNKGGLGSIEGNEHAVIDEDGDVPVKYAIDGQVDASSSIKKRKKKSKAKNNDDDQAVTEQLVAEISNHSLGKTADVEMADALDEAEKAVETGDVDLNGSERILTEHLTAQAVKLETASSTDEGLLKEQRLLNNLERDTMIGLGGFLLDNRAGDSQHPISGDVKKKRKRISNGAAVIGESQGVIVDPQLMQLDEEAALAAGINQPLQRTEHKQRKRRRATAIASVTTLGTHAVDQSAETLTKKSGRKKTVDSKSTWGTVANSSGDGPNGGTFSLDERFAIDNALHEYARVHGWSTEELRDRVWGNSRKKDEFWDSICEAVPGRSRASVYKHVRRSCHIFDQRAKWTPNEDTELANLVNEKGNKWKEIGEAMGRMGEDCRDRYRNYVKCGADRGRDRWSDEEEALLKKVVAELKELSRQALLQAGKPIPPPEEEDSVLINWTVVSEKMENKRSRIQCRYKWKKMLQQKENARTAPTNVTYVGGKKKRISFDISRMLPGDRQWLLFLIRDCGATEENQIPWDEFAKGDHEVGIWTHKDLKNAYKSFRQHIPHKRRPLAEILKQLLNELNEWPAEMRKVRFVPDHGATIAAANDRMRNNPGPIASRSPVPPQQVQFHSPISTSFESQLLQVPQTSPQSPLQTGNLAPVASMGPNVDNSFSVPIQGHIVVDPELMGRGMQGMHELEKMAGEAIAHTNGLQATARASVHYNSQGGIVDGEDEHERELRQRLGGFIQSTAAAAEAARIQNQNAANQAAHNV